MSENLLMRCVDCGFERHVPPEEPQWPECRNPECDGELLHFVKKDEPAASDERWYCFFWCHHDFWKLDADYFGRAVRVYACSHGHAYAKEVAA